jgi:hypothetical protein
VKENRRTGLLRGIAVGLTLVGAGVGAVQADVPLNGINVAYHGGSLMQHVKVVPILYGSSWQGKTTGDFIKGFLQTLFADGRYVANLAQYSAGGYTIGSGSTVDPVMDAVTLPKVDSEHAATGIRYQVTDDQIQAEIKAQYSTSKVPPPDANTLYVVFVYYDTVVIAGGGDSEYNFAAYHTYSTDGGYAYAVVCPTGDLPALVANTPTGYHSPLFNRDLTAGLSHELTEAITDPQSDGWYDEALNQIGGGEIADIADLLNAFGLITDDQIYQLLTGPDGTKYAVVAVWCNQGRTIEAFPPASSTSP